MLLPMQCQVMPISPALPEFCHRIIRSVFFWSDKDERAGCTIEFDGSVWTVNSQKYQLEYMSGFLWWYFEFKNLETQKIKRMRIFSSQLSSKAQWQLTLLFQIIGR